MTEREEKWQEVLPQIESILEGESNLVANMANAAALLKTAFDWWWVGFYLVDTHPASGPASASASHAASVTGSHAASPTSSHAASATGSPHETATSSAVMHTSSDVIGAQLVLGPFQGPVACTRIPFGRGVCGTSWKKGETIIVPDVEEFPGHIACSSLSRSEIVVPIFSKSGNEVKAVIDIDSVNLNEFSEIDRLYLEKIAKLFS